MAVLDFPTLEVLRRQHPAWRLLLADHAPLIASFLHRAFIANNVRVLAQADLVEALNDTLYGIAEQQASGVTPKFPKSAQEYLNDWAANDKGWLRKFYPPGLDEPHFDLTPATERALAWLQSLSERAFVGTESRLLTLFELLKQMSEGSDTNPQTRLAELHKRRDAIDAEIALVVSGNLPLLDDTAVKDRFQQFTSLARELLGDFREVEHNFRGLDRQVRERIALWDGRQSPDGRGRGALLHSIMGERDAIAESDQGKSFRAFWDFLMSQSRQEELTALLERVLSLPSVAALSPDARLRRVHDDWLQAGEHAQRTVAQLSQQLRRFLDDQAWLENRRIKSLAQIDYNPGRYIVLQAQTTTDAEVRDFQTELRACLDGALSGQEEGGSASGPHDGPYSEAKFLQVKAIIERLAGRTGQTEQDRRWTAKVTDVRHWFVFAASECWREDGREHEHYSDSGGKSGGQKEKLAYTILAASLAYQFGLESAADSRHQRPRSFRFVVIDEAFGRGSDESAHYGLALFEKLQLQLLIVTPLQKIHIIEPFVASVGFVYNAEGRDSQLRNLSMADYHAEKDRLADLASVTARVKLHALNAPSAARHALD